jgi:hypothetical protein
MSAAKRTATHRSPATNPAPPVTEEDWFRAYNSKPQDTAAGRAALAEARMIADSDEAAWGSAA